MSIVIYQKPSCTTCRQVHAALKESGVNFDAVNYYVEPIPRLKLIELIRKMCIDIQSDARPIPAVSRAVGAAAVRPIHDLSRDD
jgi:arsenate reductase